MGAQCRWPCGGVVTGVGHRRLVCRGGRGTPVNRVGARRASPGPRRRRGVTTVTNRLHRRGYRPGTRCWVRRPPVRVAIPSPPGRTGQARPTPTGRGLRPTVSVVMQCLRTWAVSPGRAPSVSGHDLPRRTSCRGEACLAPAPQARGPRWWGGHLDGRVEAMHDTVCVTRTSTRSPGPAGRRVRHA